jgi:glutamate synthase domain-containing protein 3
MYCNPGLVDLVPVDEQEDIEKLKSLIKEHYQYTDSTVAKNILDEWDISLSKFVKVFPKDYRRVLEEHKQKNKEVA